MARRKTRIALLLVLGTATLLGGCVSRSKYPSLARRPAEDIYRVARPAPPPPPPSATLSEGLASRLANLRAQAAEAHQAFEAARPAALRAVGAARGAARGTENWSVASIALAQLESARARAGIPLADLDRLETEASNRAVDGSDTDLKAVVATRREVEDLVAGETAVIDSLLPQLAQ